MKFKLFLIIFLLFSFKIYTQFNNSSTYIHVKNGNIYYGKIIELVRGDHIKLKTASENIIYINWNDIVNTSKYSIKNNSQKLLTFNELKKKYLNTKYVVSFNSYFRENIFSPFITIEKPLFLDLKDYLFISTNLLYDKKFFTNIDLLLGYKFLKVKNVTNFYISFALGGYYSFFTHCKNKLGITAELTMGNIILMDGVKSSNIRIGLKLIVFYYEYEILTPTESISEDAGPELYLTFGLGFNI